VADEARLARRVERGDLAANDELVTANLGLVYALAQHYRGRGVPLDDSFRRAPPGSSAPRRSSTTGAS
jgi:DNA-directed RNA polymerase sigma subunit (sigma70/sigma32)